MADHQLKRILLFDVACAACSRLAAYARDSCAGALEIRSLRDSGVLDELQAAGIKAPDSAALMCVDEGTVRLLTGIRMRWELARCLGPRRSREAMNLLAQEIGARAGRQLTRRGMFGLAGGGALGLALGMGQPAAAEGQEGVLVTPARNVVDRLLRTSAVRSTLAIHGPVDTSEVIEVHGDGEQVLVLQHKESSVVTFVDKQAVADPTVVSIDVVPRGSRKKLRFFDAHGTHLANVGVHNGRVESSPGAGLAEVRPDSVTYLFITCFSQCIADGVDAGCLDSCYSCAGGRANSCLYCSLCAGPRGIHCARSCRKKYGS